MLSIDPLWRGFMNYVYAHGGWSGDAPGWDTTVPVQADVDYAAAMRAAVHESRPMLSAKPSMPLEAARVISDIAQCQPLPSTNGLGRVHLPLRQSSRVYG